MSSSRTVLITGAGQGIGLEWARQEAADGATVIATARDPGESAGLETAMRERPGKITVMKMDVVDQSSVDDCVREVTARHPALDDLINNAGTYGPRDDRGLGADPSHVDRVLAVNAVGPYRVTRGFLPLLRRGRSPRILFVTSRMGSIGDSPSGAAYGYRMSKAALNMLGANLARDLREEGMLCLLLHPGWARTRMGGSRASVPVDEAVAGMRRVAGCAGLTHSGAFLDYTGEIVPF
jgi:NAD(P)-dependent dehydrogenase (short-subunit alcohol dehydrogenase family)